MNEENEDTLNEEEGSTEEVQPSEIDTLRSRCDILGIGYKHNTGIKKLKILINAKLEPEETNSEDEEIEEEVEIPQVVVKKAKKIKKVSKTELAKLDFEKRRKEALLLVRIRVTNMNPDKKAWTGEFISGGSARMGTVKRFVPFDNEDGWHVEKILLDIMRDRRFTKRTEKKGKNGVSYVDSKQVPEFGIEILDPLTPKERDALARQQVLADNQ